MKNYTEVMNELRTRRTVRKAFPTWEGAIDNHLDIHPGAYNHIGYDVVLETDFKPIDPSDPNCRKGEFQSRKPLASGCRLEDAVLFAVEIAKEVTLPVYFQREQNAKYLDPVSTGNRDVLYHPEGWVPNDQFKS
ncbi:MAG TPA: hypothetical protein VJB66_00790 [Candidatus Nanoarchaeia archaeon]|nr:hypothetical protein [Candidatus Nanoarchaeia archaeon]